VPALPATDATTIALTQPSGVAVAPDGTVYIACAAAFHHLIAVIGLTVSELGTLNLNLPTAIAIDPYGNPVVADDLGQTVYRIKKTSGEFFPFGTGNPTGVAVDSAGLVYFVDTSVYAISVYDPVQNSSSTFAGTTVQGFADGPISTAKFMSPRSITVDSQGNLFLIDGAKIREVLF
jgi:DNA-binding beta-propeller fold protein YncE